MKHRHPGSYISRKPKGGHCTKRNPIHCNEIKLRYIKPKLRYRNMNYPQLKREFNISKIGDDDGDGVPNYKDCHPWDKKRQDEDFESMKSELTDRIESRKSGFLGSRGFTLHTVSQEVESMKEGLQNRRDFLVNLKRESYGAIRSLKNIDSAQSIVEMEKEKINNYDKEISEIDNFINWMDDTDNQISFLPTYDPDESVD